MLIRRKYAKTWLFSNSLVAFFVLVPLLSIVAVGFLPHGEWAPVPKGFFTEYLFNSLGLSFLTLCTTFIIGTTLAFLVVFYDFPGKRFFEWALVLPLSIPAYLMAFSYAEFTGYSGPLAGVGLEADIKGFNGAVFIFTLSLYPYVYLPTRLFFKANGHALAEVAASLGSSFRSAFFRVLLPVARPAIVGGLFLVMMEVLNDYGVVKYFGVPTFTSGIFRSWFGAGDMFLALRLAALLLCTVLVLYFLERQYRRRFKFSIDNKRSYRAGKTSFIKQVLILFCCSSVFILAFLVPTGQMVAGALQTYERVLNHDFYTVAGNTFLLAILGAGFTVFFSIVLEFGYRLNRTHILSRLAVYVSGLGYAMPGAIIACGILFPLLHIDRWLYSSSITSGLWLTSGMGILVYAVVIRFLAVGLQAVHSGYAGVSYTLTDASRGLGLRPASSLLKIDLPLLRNFLVTAFLLVFVDILKELPLTLILRPFNFDTLATKAYGLASDELLRESANPSLIIVLSGLAALLLLNRSMKK